MGFCGAWYGFEQNGTAVSTHVAESQSDEAASGRSSQIINKPILNPKKLKHILVVFTPLLLRSVVLNTCSSSNVGLSSRSHVAAAPATCDAWVQQQTVRPWLAILHHTILYFAIPCYTMLHYTTRQFSILCPTRIISNVAHTVS